MSLKISPVTKAQWKKVLTATLFVGGSAMADYVISITQGTQFGTLTPVINIVAVLVKQMFTKV